MAGVEGAYRSSRAHGKRAVLMHFSGKSGDLCLKLSDRMSEGGEQALFLRSGGKRMIVATLQGICVHL